MLLDNTLAARILLVSDDAQLRALLGGLLVAHGYVGVSGVDSQAALAAERLGAEWEIAIVDVSVPSCSAVRALRALQATTAALVVIVPKKNGNATPHELAAGGDVVLGKPFDPRELLLLIRGLLQDNPDVEESSDAPMAPPSGSTPLSRRGSASTTV